MHTSECSDSSNATWYVRQPASLLPGISFLREIWKVEIQAPQPFLRFLFNAVLLIELLNTSIGSRCLLLTSIERMAFGAYFYVNLGLCGAGHESIATVTGHSRLIVLGMDSFLHLIHLSIIITLLLKRAVQSKYYLSFTSALLMEPQTALLL